MGIQLPINHRIPHTLFYTPGGNLDSPIHWVFRKKATQVPELRILDGHHILIFLLATFTAHLAAVVQRCYEGCLVMCHLLVVAGKEAQGMLVSVCGGIVPAD